VGRPRSLSLGRGWPQDRLPALGEDG